eukprot:9028368-Alexandrium_andersonii.AAC.1
MTVVVRVRVQCKVCGALCLGSVCYCAPSISEDCFNPGQCPGEIAREANTRISVSPMSCVGISAYRLIGAELRQSRLSAYRLIGSELRR